MFNSLEEAIKMGENKDNNDGGRPVFYKNAVAIKDKNGDVDWEDQVWVKIFNIGDPKNVMERPKRKEDEQRWPKQWQAYLDNEEPDIDGIPLKDFPNITPAERKKCEALKIRSVEELADYPDGQIDNLGGRGFMLKKKAKEFIEYKEGTLVKSLEDRIKELEKLVESNSSGNNSERSTGDQSSKSKRTNKGKSGSSRKGVSAFRDDSETAS